MELGVRGEQEVDIRSAESVQIIVRASERDARRYLDGAPFCALLARRQICHLASADMAPPFKIVRASLSGTFFIATIDGWGEVLIDGRWVVCGPGRGVLLAPGSYHAFRIGSCARWRCCWVRYQEHPDQQPIARMSSPTVQDYDARPLRHAIEGLYCECESERNPASEQSWVELIHQYVMQIAAGPQLDPRLWCAWKQVEEKIAHPWDTAQLARIAHVSAKQFERLCKRELGRTPRQQLIWLRMHAAARQLCREGWTVEAVAHEVGYDNPFVFSRTFKRTMGCSPSHFASHL